MYAVIALQPEKQDEYERFMKKLSESKQYTHFINKMNKLLEEAKDALII